MPRSSQLVNGEPMLSEANSTPFFEDGYNRTEATARRLGVSTSYMNKGRLNGSGPPFVKFGHSVRYHWPTVRAWAEERTSRSTSDCGGVTSLAKTPPR